MAFALAAHHVEHGSYPETLDELVPEYMARLPVDLFSGRPLRYSRAGSGYVLYSVGQNEKDDGGKTYGEGEGTDDLVIRTPSQ